MKKKRIQPLFLALVFASIISGCDINNPVIDDWWVGRTPQTSVLKAEAPIESYHITFDSNGGTYIDLVKTPVDSNPWPQDIKPGLKASEPGLVTKTGGFLSGWYTDANNDGVDSGDWTLWDFNTPPTGSMKLYAGWAASGKTVKFNPTPPAGSGLTFSNCNYTPQDESIAEGGRLTEPKQFGLKTGDPLTDMYYFDGWYTDNNNNGSIDAFDTKWNFGADTATNAIDAYDGADGTINLYAKWSEKTGQVVHTVTFDAGGATGGARAVPPAQDIHDGDRVSRPTALTKTDYVFDGWYADGSDTNYNFDDPVTGDMTLHARWKLQPYSPTYFRQDNYAVIVNLDMDKSYYPFQFDAGEGDSSTVYDGDGDPTGLVDDNDNVYNQIDVIDILKDTLNAPNAVAMIKGYGDTEALIKEREENIRDLLITDNSGVREDQLIKFTDYNGGSGPVGTDGDEVKVYIFIKSTP